MGAFLYFTAFSREMKTEKYSWCHVWCQNSALMLVCARLRYVAGTKWGLKRYMNVDLLDIAKEVAA